MPFKEEDISSNPYMKLYHDIIFDKEINTITNLAEKDVSKNSKIPCKIPKWKYEYVQI